MEVEIKDYSQVCDIEPKINDVCYVLSINFHNGECFSYAFHTGKDMSSEYKRILAKCKEVGNEI